MVNLKRWLGAQKREKKFALRRYAGQTSQEGVEQPKEKRDISPLLSLTRSSAEGLKSRTVLEIGGRYYAELAADGIPGTRAIILDPLVDVFQNRSKRCEYVRGRAEEIQMDNKSVDFCICQNAIDHMQDPRKALQEIRRVLKSDGKLYITCNVYGRWARILFPLFGVLDVPHPHHFSQSSFLGLLTKAGFQPDLPVSVFRVPIYSYKSLMGKILGLRQVDCFCSMESDAPHQNSA